MPDESADSEKEFYTALSGLDESLATPDDLVDLRDGAQCVVDGERITLVMPLDKAVAAMLVSSCEHVFDHDCEQGREFIKFFAYVAGTLVVAAASDNEDSTS